MNSICITASQAKEIVENRRLELFSPCEWQPPENALMVSTRGNKCYFRYQAEGFSRSWSGKELTPPHQVGDVVLVKEPWWYEVAYGVPKKPDDHHMFYAANQTVIDQRILWMPAFMLPDYLVRTKAKVTEIELQLHEGKLRWRRVLEPVE